MKKFLFTLASLFVASSAFANSYFFMDKVEITEDMVGQEITLTVGADFRELVSAFELWITMPEGLEIVDFEVGADMKGMKYYNQRGRENSIDASVTTLDNMHFVGITSATTTGYYQLEDGTWAPYGAIKWLPGVYEEMIILYVEVNAVPTGDVVIRTEPGCGQDPRADQYGGRAVPEGGATLPWGERLPDDVTPEPAPVPTFSVVDGKLYAECADHEVVLMLDGTVVENPYPLPAATFEDQVLNFSAYTVANADDSENSATVEYPVTIAAKEDAKAPAPAFRVEDGKLYAESNEGLEVVMMKDGVACENPYTLPTENPSYTEDIVLNFTAYALADGENYNINSDNATYTFTLEHQTKKTCDSPSIMIIDRTDETVTIGIFPDENTDGELEYEANPAPGAKATELVYTRGDADYTVNVKARTKEGATYQASDWAEENITIPAKPAPEVTKTPSVTYSYENGELTVWAYGSDDDAVYTLYCDGVEYTGEMPITYDIYEGYNHTWTATAIAPGKTVSEMSADCVINIPAEQKVYTTPDPVIGEPVVVDDNTVTVTVTGQGNIVVTVTTYDENGNAVTETYTGRDEVVVPFTRGENDEFVQISATATADLPEGYDVVAPGQATEPYVVIPAKPVVPQTAMPDYTITEGVSSYVYLTDENGNIIYAPDGKPAAAVDENGNRIIDVNGHWKEVTFTNMDEADAVIEFSYDGETWYVWDGEPLNFANDGTYVIYVRATATGKTVSDVNTVTVVITPKTSVDELVNGKAVAGVRYFNMAGQEMQEANGVTIVVTTYTDGTTSAVKVIK